MISPYAIPGGYQLIPVTPQGLPANVQPVMQSAIPPGYGLVPSSFLPSLTHVFPQQGADPSKIPYGTPMLVHMPRHQMMPAPPGSVPAPAPRPQDPNGSQR